MGSSAASRYCSLAKKCSALLTDRSHDPSDNHAEMSATKAMN